jgi:hypothetical protein
MKRILASALFLAASLLTAHTAMAQDRAVKVTIPFSFNVNDTQLPAGDYTIVADLDQPAILTFRDRKDSIVAVNLAITDKTGSGKAGTVEFNHYGDQYFLREIRFESASKAVFFPASKQEKRIKKLNDMEHRSLATL